MIVHQDHWYLIILYEITSFAIKNFQCDASVATLLNFLLKSNFDINAFADT